MKSVSIAILILTLLVGSAAIFALNGASIDLSFLKAATSPSSDTENPQAMGKEDRTVAAPVERAVSEIAALGDLAGDGAGAAGDNAGEQGPSFDVVRIDPDGTSVFAGRAASSEQISIIAGETPIGTAKADASGNWVLVTEKKIADPNAELKIVKGIVQPELPPGEKARTAEARANDTAVSGGKASAREVNDRMIASLEQMIETARGQQVDETRARAAHTARETASDGNAPSGSLPSPPLNSATPGDDAGSPATTTAALQRSDRATTSGDAQSADLVADAAPSHNEVELQGGDGPGKQEGNQEGNQQVRGASAQSIPIPIQFVYREATFTEQGRKAVSLLLEYLLVANPRQVTLTGHADERGSYSLNMTLSQERLQAVSDYVRAGGYTGELTMTPKGETEPYQGVDRSKYPRDELYTLDRRVELRLDG